MKAIRLAPSRTVLVHIAVVIAGVIAAASSAATQARIAPHSRAYVNEVQLRAGASFRVGFGEARHLAAGSRWKAVGVLPEGTVYRPVATVVTIDAPAAVEAYPVIAGARLKGFFLPRDASFVPVTSASSLEVENQAS